MIVGHRRSEGRKLGLAGFRRERCVSDEGLAERSGGVNVHRDLLMTAVAELESACD
jgi:hypothetical protein